MPIRFRFNELDWRSSTFLDKRQEEELSAGDPGAALEFLRQRMVAVFVAKKAAAIPDWLSSVERLQERLQSFFEQQEQSEQEEASGSAAALPQLFAPEGVLAADEARAEAANDAGEDALPTIDLEAIFATGADGEADSLHFPLLVRFEPEALQVPAFLG